MRDLTAYAIECMTELDNIGIEYGNIIEFTVNTRAKKRWGQCKAVPGGYSINISNVLLDERNDIKGLKETIHHELLHSCKGCMNHGNNWKRLAQKVNRTYGYNIKRTNSAADKGVLEETRPPVKQREINHKVVCLDCGHIYTRTKASKLITHTSHYRCGCCHGKLKLEY